MTLSAVTASTSAGDPGSGLLSPAERLGSVARAVRRRWVVTLLVLSLVQALAAGQLVRATPMYEAHVEALLQPSDAVLTQLNRDVALSPANAQRDLDTNAALITFTPVAEAVRRDLRLRTPVVALLKQVSVEGAETSNLVTITAKDPSPERAAAIASSFARQAALYRQQVVRAEFDAAIESGRQALAEVSDPIVADDVRGRLRELRAVQAVQTGGLRIVRDALVPDEPVAPRAGLVLGFGLVVGLVLAVLVALAVDRLDPRLRGRRAFGQALGVPVLAELPSDAPGADQAVEDLAALLAARGLAADGRRLLLLDVDPSVPRSPERARLASKGAPARARVVAERLAETLSASRRDVVLVEVLGGPVAAEGERDGRAGGRVERLRLPARARGADGVLAGDLVTAIEALDHRRPRPDVVVIGGRGVLPLRGSAGLVAACDDIVLVARDRRTTRAAARQARQALGDGVAKVAGAVVLLGGGLPPPVETLPPGPVAAVRSRLDEPVRPDDLVEQR